jgi:hypothetical protein
LRHVLSRVPPVAARRIAGDNAVRMLGLDREELAKVARQIGAPTIDELRRPPSELPEISFRSNAFRGQAGSLRSSGGSAL